MAAESRWRDIAEQLRQRIEAGKFAEGKDGRPQLPKETELREEFNTSRNTIRDAINWLVERGIVETEPGKGTFVVFKPQPLHVTLSLRGPGSGGGEGKAYVADAQGQGREWDDTSPEVKIEPAEVRIARYLELPTGTQVILRHQQRRIDGRPWSLQTSYYPLSFVHDGATRLLEARDIEEGGVAYIEVTLKRKQVGYHDEINARPPNPGEVTFFHLSERASVVVFETYRTAYDTDGKPFRLTVTVWPADRNRLHYNVGKVPARVIDAPGLHSVSEDSG
jgi:GntR family transcriptional regulator